MIESHAGGIMDSAELQRALIESSKKALRLPGPHSDRGFQNEGSTSRIVESACETFLQRWYTNSDSQYALTPDAAAGSYFFLFWKNLSITNVSVIELLSLIRLRAKSRSTQESIQIEFLGTQEFKDIFSNTYSALLSPLTPRLERAATEEDVDAICRALADGMIEFYQELFSHTILFDLYWTSSIIHIPPTLQVDIGMITVESGYIHSSGPAIFFRNIEKVEEKDLAKRLTGFVEAYLRMSSYKKLLVIPYAHEFFHDYESNSSVSVRNGLDGVRIKLRKHHVQGHPLLSFLALLREKFLDGKIIVPQGTIDYSDERNGAKADGADPACTVWFVTDSSYIEDNAHHAINKGREIFLIVYAQLFYNYNQLLIYKERKPGWLASTTIPHTLSAALVNIARYQQTLIEARRTRLPLPAERLSAEPSKPLLIMDPFCGTGTTLFDAIIRFDNATVVGLDSAPMARHAVVLNREFFSIDVDGLAHLISFFNVMKHELEDDLKKVERGEKSKLLAEAANFTSIDLTKNLTSEQALRICLFLVFREICERNGRSVTHNVSDKDIITVSKKGFQRLHDVLAEHKVKIEHKAAIYSIWRSLLMNTFSMRNEQRSEKIILRTLLRECDGCLREYGDHRDLLKTTLAPGNPVNLGKFRLGIGSYSRAGAIDIEAFKNIASFDSLDGLGSATAHQMRVCTTEDSISALKHMTGAIDIIITDPPFGFNEFDDDTERMRHLYAELVPVLVQALKSWGQLIVALPGFAKNGKQIPYYMTAPPMVRKVLSETERQKRRCVSFVETFPGCRNIVHAPWYWGGTSTVERRILHFIID